MISLRCLLLSVTASLLVGLTGPLVETRSRAQQKPDPKFEEDFPTPLLQAIVLNEPDRVSYLLSNGANPNGADHSKYTKIPLLLATERGNIGIVKILLDAGADKEVKQEIGMTSLFLAVLRRNLEMVKLLVKRGANVNARTDNNSTCLMSAAADSEAIAILQFLISAGGDVNAANQLGATPLMGAGDNAEVVELLLRTGATIESADYKGRTAICHARKLNQPKKLAVLLQHGAKDIECPL